MFAQLNSQIIYYEKLGEGEKEIIMSHGNGETHEVFYELAASLSPYYTVFLFDTRGHGKSATPKEYHYIDMAEDIINLSTFLDLKEPELLGFSDGAISALMAEIKCPGTFKRLYLLGANLSPKGLSRKALKEIKKAYKKTKDPLSYLMLSEPDISPDLLSRVKSECLIFAGENDMIKESETREIASRITDSKLFILPGEDHGSYITHSDKLKDFILQK